MRPDPATMCQAVRNLAAIRFANRYRIQTTQTAAAVRAIASPIASAGCVAASHVSAIARTSSPKLTPHVLKGSGLVHRKPRRRLTAVRRERHRPRDERRADPPRLVHARDGREREDRRGGRPDERVDHVPDVVHGGNLIRDEFHDVEEESDPEDQRMRKRLQRLRQRDRAEAMEQPQRGHRGVDVEPRREGGAEDEAERRRGHGLSVARSAPFGDAPRETCPGQVAHFIMTSFPDPLPSGVTIR